MTAKPGKTVTETQRLLLREMTQGDLDALCAILCDPEVMAAAYETPFTREEAQGWLERHLKRYETLGYGLWAVVEKESGKMIGQCGLTLQHWEGEEVLEIGYLFQKAYWHKGYAAEAAAACKEYAFSVLKAPRVYSMVRDTNLAAQRVALRTGMAEEARSVKKFRGVDMTFLLYVARQNGE